ncbi:unnamed protein product, partial [Polarella glacialis]
AASLLRHMAVAQVLPDLVCLSICISSCEKAGLWEQAVGLLRRLPTLRLLPDAVSFNAAISACEKSGQLLDGVKWQRALDLLSVMACGPQPL